MNKFVVLKRRSREYVYASLEKTTISWMHSLSRLLVRAQVYRKGVYMTSFKRGYMWFTAKSYNVHQNQRFALTTIVNAHLWAFLNRRFETTLITAKYKHGRNSAFCSNCTRLKTLIFRPQKLRHKSYSVQFTFVNCTLYASFGEIGKIAVYFRK